MDQKLANDVRGKFFQDFERLVDTNASGAPSATNNAVDAMLRGFILEGNEIDSNGQPQINEQDWFYRL